MIEGGAFPSDQYAVASQAKVSRIRTRRSYDRIISTRWRGDTKNGRYPAKDQRHADELAMVLFGGVNYFTGQFFDMPAITRAAHQAGAIAGFDLAHAAGNVMLNLHDWDVDFAAWCSYKYMNSGPGAISGVFVHEKHFNDKTINKFEGWWGFREDKRFLMPPVFEAETGAAAWQLSTSPAILLALHKASLEIFELAGGLENLRKKSELLTGYLEFLIIQINQSHKDELFKSHNPNKRCGAWLPAINRL